MIEALHVVAALCLALALLAPRWHALRRAVTRVIGWRGRGHCLGCNSRLTDDERRYYGHNCELCEAHDYDRS